MTKFKTQKDEPMPVLRGDTPEDVKQYQNDIIEKLSSNFRNTRTDLDEIQKDMVPPGTLLSFSGETIPDSFLECDGSQLEKTAYSRLLDAIGTIYGETDGAGGVGTTHFKIPDLRGRFIRGWAHGSANDPDRASRTNRGDSQTGDKVGTLQADQYKAHYHSISLWSVWGGGGAYYGGGGVTGYHYTNSPGGNETRPVNINAIYIIKY